MKKIQRGCALLLLLLLLPFSALGGNVTAACSSLLGREAPWSADLSLTLSEYMPYGAARLEMLNGLLGHLSLQTFEGLEDSGFSIRMDGEEILGLRFRKEGADPAGFRFSFDPDTLYTGGELSDVTGLSSLQQSLLSLSLPPFLTADKITWADEGFSLLENLPEVFPEYTKHSDTKTRLKDVGLSTRKTVITVPKDAVEEGAMTRLGEGSSPLHAFLRSLSFSGRQQFVLYFNENGHLLKANYSGQTGAPEAQRKMTVEWRGLRENETFDELTIKAPALKGSDRDTLFFSRRENAGEGGEQLLSEFDWTRVRSKTKSQLKGSADLLYAAENAALSGSLSLSVMQGGEEKTLILEPKLIGVDQEKTEGTLRFRYLEEEAPKLDAGIKVQLSAGAPEQPSSTGKTVDLSKLSGEERAELSGRIRERTAAALLRSMLNLPPEDLRFLTNELEDGQWQRVLQAVGINEGGTDR